MTRHHARRAIIVLEAPWELDVKDANRTSVLPFIEGVAKLAGDTEVLHANFYDESSFEYALRCLCKNRYQNAIVYIAAHGWKGRVGTVPLRSLLSAIADVSAPCNITGVLLGSCYGANVRKRWKTASRRAICAGASATHRAPGGSKER